MAESSPRWTFTVFAGSCAAGVACSALDMATTPPVTITATRTGAAASAHVLRFTGRSSALARKSPHFSCAALNPGMSSAPRPFAEGIFVVSISGPSLAGSGKSLMPLSRMHWANLRAGSCSLALRLRPMNPGGCRSLHAAMAASNAGLFASSDEPFTTPSIVISPDASGSGNSLTPLSRMHAANFIALSRPPAFVVGCWCWCWCCCLVSAGVFEQPAPIRATMARASQRP